METTTARIEEGQGAIAQASAMPEENEVERESRLREQIAWLAAMSATAAQLQALAYQNFEQDWSNEYTELAEALFLMTDSEHLNKDLQAALKALVEGLLNTPSGSERNCIAGMSRMIKAILEAERAAYRREYDYEA